MNKIITILGIIFLFVLLFCIIISIKLLDVAFTALLLIFGAVYVAWIVILILFD